MWKLSVRIKKQQVNIFDHFFLSLDAKSISFEAVSDDHKKQHCSLSLSAIFEESSYFAEIVEALRLLLPDLPIVKYDKISCQDWHGKWKSEIRPILCDFGLSIYPTWWKEKRRNDVIIKMDPGQAFGTGSHETTQLCLASIFDFQNKEKGVILDFGCGTGILGMAAYFVGFDRVYAVDEDPVAINIATKNFKHNGIPDEKISIFASLDIENIFFDVIVANITLNTLIDFSSRFSKWIRPGGTLLLSGILNRQEDSLIHEYKASFSIVSKKQLNEWSLVALKRSRE